MGQDIITTVEIKLEELSKHQGLRTSQIRAVSSSIFRQIEDKSLDNILNFCQQLLDRRMWSLGVVAYDWAFRLRKQYTEDTFYIFEEWLKKYVTDWGDCDDFCTHAFGNLISQHNRLFSKVVEWTDHPDFWVRRASAVVLIYPINKQKAEGIDPFIISDRLMQDPHYLVVKGYGWMLKVLSIAEPDLVYDYLVKNREKMPRLAFRYAVEKFDKQRRALLML